MGQSGAILLPLYLVIDVSEAMAGEGVLDAANAIVPAVADTIARNPTLADKVRFGLIDFAGTARVRLPLCNVRQHALDPPTLAVRAGMSYAAAFDLLRREIETDVTRLKADGFAVHHPMVWFVSGAEPAGGRAEWHAAFDRLIAGTAYPNLIPCGVGTARPDTMAGLVHPAAGAARMSMYLAKAGYRPAQVITGIAELIIFSLIRSGYGLGHGDAVILPEVGDLPPGTARYEPDDFV
jgi:uncharacterized protein YegL